MRLYIIRHADPDYPNNTITPGGHLEAQALAKRMKKQGLDRIYTSPLGRAIDTMKYSAEALGMEYNIEEWTSEWDGVDMIDHPYEYTTCWDLPGEVIRAKEPYPTHETWREAPYLDVPKIEKKLKELREGSDAFFERHGYVREGGRYRIKNQNELKIAVFCHGGFGLCWLSALLEIPVTLVWAGFWLPPSSVTTILFDQRSKEFAVPRCIGLGDVSHLYEAGLEVKPRGIKTNFW